MARQGQGGPGKAWQGKAMRGLEKKSPGMVIQPGLSNYIISAFSPHNSKIICKV